MRTVRDLDESMKDFKAKYDAVLEAQAAAMRSSMEPSEWGAQMACRLHEIEV